MIEGSLVYLDTIDKGDLEKLRLWRNREDFRKHFREYREISKDMQLAWYETKVLNDNATIMFAIRSMQNNELLGCCGLCYINWVHKNADLSLYIGWENAYIDDKGYAEEACKLLFKYGFHELGLQKIWTEIYVFDQLKYSLYMALGFHVDGRLRNQYFYDGRWWDSYILSILSSEFDLK